MQIACRQSDCTWNCVPTRKQDYLLQLEQSLTCVCVLSCTCCEADFRFEPEAIMYLDMYGCKRCLCNLCQSSTCTFAWRIHTHGCMAWAGIPIYPTLGGFCASSDRCQKAWYVLFLTVLLTLHISDMRCCYCRGKAREAELTSPWGYMLLSLWSMPKSIICSPFSCTTIIVIFSQ